MGQQSSPLALRDQCNDSNIGIVIKLSIQESEVNWFSLRDSDMRSDGIIILQDHSWNDSVAVRVDVGGLMWTV